MGLLHGTVVVMANRGICLRGASGSGKSSLALKLIERGAILLGDDYVEIRPDNKCIFARCPDTIAGKIEVRGIGILTFPYVEEHQVHLVIDLGTNHPDRLPEPTYTKLESINVRLFSFHKDDLTLAEKVTILANEYDQICYMNKEF